GQTRLRGESRGSSGEISFRGRALGEQLRPPAMDLGHRTLKFVGQVTSRQVDILKGSGQVSMAGKGRNSVQFPTGSGEVCKAKMAQGMSAELGNRSQVRDPLHHLRPGPDRDGLREVAI